MKKSEIISFLQYLKRVEDGLEELDSKFKGFNFYHLEYIQKVNFTSKGVTLNLSLTFTPIKSGINEAKMGFSHFELHTLPEVKFKQLQRENVFSKEKRKDQQIVEKVSDNQVIVKSLFNPPLQIGDIVKWKFSVFLKGYKSEEKDSVSVQVVSPTRYLKLLVYLNKPIRKARAYKSIVSFKSTIGESPIEENHNFTFSQNVAKLEVFEPSLSTYKIEWES